MNGVTKAPIGGALVEASAVSSDGGIVHGSTMRQLTDANGRFAFQRLPAGLISLRARKLGFLEIGSHAGPDVPPRRVSLKGGEWVSNVVMPLWRPGAIGGTVRNERGDAVVDVWVRVWMKLRVLGHERFVARRLTRTDDRGRYRFGGLAPGRYVVQVPSAPTAAPQFVDQSVAAIAPWRRRAHSPVPPPPRDGQSFAYPGTFSPGVRTLALATIVEVAPGEAREGVDVTLDPAPAFQLSGIVIGPNEALDGLMLRLTADGAEALGREGAAATTVVGEDGRFTVFNVPAGVYTIEASQTVTELKLRSAAADLQELEFSFPLHRPDARVIMHDVDLGPEGLRAEVTTFGRDGSGHWARQSIALEKNETNVLVSMREAGTMRGRIRKELAPDRAIPAMEPSVGIELDPADGSPQLGVLRSTSRSDNATRVFTIPGMLPGKYFLRVKHGWIVKSISWNGRDYTDSPFDSAETPNFNDVEVIVTNAGATLSGIVVDEDGAAVNDALVVLFPEAPELWTDIGLWPSRIRSVVSDSNGRYEIAGVPAGRYYITTARNAAGLVASDPELFKQAHWRANRISLEWARLTKLDLVVPSALH